MKLAYNPLGLGAYTPAPAYEDDIIFDLVAKVTYVKGVPFYGKKYEYFKKHTSPDNTGGSEGLVPAPSYTTTNNRLLREDGEWVHVPGALPPDSILDINSTNAVENQAITKEIQKINAQIILKAEHVYKNIIVNGILIQALGTNDTLEFIQGDGIALTPNPDDKTIIISTKVLGQLGINTYYASGQLVVKVDDLYYNHWNEAYNWYRSVTDEDTDVYINKWLEIVDFLNNVLSGTNILDEFVTRKTNQTIIGTKTFSLQIISTIAEGTAPLTVISTTKIENLNADLLDGYHESKFFKYRGWASPKADLNTIVDNSIRSLNGDNGSYVNSPVNYGNLISFGDYDSTSQYGKVQFLTSSSTELYVRNNFNGWKNWKQVAFTTDIPNVTDYYWANILILSASDPTTIPTFGGAIVNGHLTISGDIYSLKYEICNNDDNPFIKLVSKDNQTSYFQALNGKSYIGSTSTRSLVVDSAGNVGIGIDPPSARLHVASSALTGVLINSSYNPSGVTRGITIINSNLALTISAGVALLLGKEATKYNTGHVAFRNIGGLGSTSNYITLGLFGVDNVLNIVGTRNVGIDITAPEQKLHILGLSLLSQTANGDLFYLVQGLTYHIGFGLGGGGVNRGIYDFTNESWMLYRDATTNVLIPKGNVGIGTTTPSAKLHVIGESKFTDTVHIYADSSGNYTEGIRLYGTAKNSTWSNIHFGCDPAATSGTHANQWLFGRDTSNRLVFRNNTTDLTTMYSTGLITSSGCIYIANDSVGNYTLGIRIKQISTSNMSSVWLATTNASGYDTGMWGISATNTGNLRFRGGATAASDLMTLSLTGYLNVISNGAAFNGDITLHTTNVDRFITFKYNNANPYSWRIGYLGTGSGDANYLVIQSAKAAGSSWTNAIRLGNETLSATFGGPIYTIGSAYADDFTSGALFLNNSNIQGVNAIYFADTSESALEGINFYRSTTTVDTIWGASGVLYYSPNRTLGSNGTNYTVLHSGNYSSILDARYYTESEANSRFVNVTGDTMTGTLHMKSQTGSYSEGIRIYPYSSWSTLMLLGTDITAASGTSTGSWGLFNNAGTFYINKGTSSGANNSRAMGTSTGWTFGNTSRNSYALNAASFICDSWVRTCGATGWYNESYGGGIYMLDSTWVRTYNSKSFYCSATIQAGGRIYTGYDAGVTNSISCSNWFRSNGNTGWYNPTNECHVYPNNISTYGGLILRGTKGSYNGFLLGTSTSYLTVMSTGVHHGLYCENTGLWEFYYNRSSKAVGILTGTITKTINLSGSTYISSTLDMGGAINTASTPGTWVSGMSGAAILYRGLSAIDASSFWRFYNMKSSSGHVVCYGGLGNNIGFYGYYAGRTANSYDWYFVANTAKGTWTATASIYAAHFYENSDILLKTNILEILRSDNMPTIKEFDWKEDGSHSYGLIAQELEELGYSELVSLKDDGYKTVNYSAALSLIVGKLQVKIKELEKEIEILKNKN